MSSDRGIGRVECTTYYLEEIGYLEEFSTLGKSGYIGLSLPVGHHKVHSSSYNTSSAQTFALFLGN